MSQVKTGRLIDGSLRLWSDDIGLGTIVAAAGWNVDHLHLPGDVVSKRGRRASRHYAAVQAVSLNVDEEISIWLNTMADQIRYQHDLVIGLVSGRIEAVIWLALFGCEAHPLPNVDELVLADFDQQRVRVLIENYTDLDADGLPRRTWLTSAPRRT